MRRDRVLVTTDLSENSYKVIDKAMNYALAQNMWLEVLHVAEPSLFAFGFSKDDKAPELSEKEQEILVEFSQKIKEKMGRTIDKMNVETRLGDVSSMVDAYSKEKRADLIVIGDSERKGGVKELVLGSTAKRIIARADVPVLVVKTSEDISYKKVFIPTDFSDRSLSSVAYLAESQPKAEFILWHTIDVPSDIQLAFYNLDDSYLTGFTASAKAIASEKMDRFVAQLRAKGGACETLNIKTEFETGHMNGELVAHFANKLSADLIGLAADTALFSNTFTIVEKSHSDVMLYKQ